MFVVTRTEAMTVNTTWDEILTWTHFVGYVLHQFSCASPMCKDSPVVCMKTTWRGWVHWNVIWSPYIGFKACLWTWAGVIPCSAHLGGEISSRCFWLLKGKIAHQWGTTRRHCAQASSRWTFPASPGLPLCQYLRALRLLSHQIPELTVDKEHFY